MKGSFEIPGWLGSYSTNVVARAGGYHGRFLKKEDEIFLRQSYPQPDLLAKKSFISLSLKADASNFYSPSETIRLIKGNEWDWLNEESKQKFSNSGFKITPQSNRMGFRMNGEALQTVSKQELISTAVTSGTIQLLPNGQIIILMSDHQTTGGYPRIGHIISADIPKLAQTPVNSTTSFRFINIKESEELLLNQQVYLLQLQKKCITYLNDFFRKHKIN